MRNWSVLLYLPALMALLASCLSTGRSETVTPAAVPSSVTQDSARQTSRPAQPQPAQSLPARPRTVTLWLPETAETRYPDGVLTSAVRYGYAANGDPLTEEQFDARGTLVSRKLYSYAENGVRMISTTDSGGVLTGRIIQEFRSGLLSVETVEDGRGQRRSTAEYGYDDAGRRISYLVQASSGNRVETVYIYEDDRIARMLVRGGNGETIKRFERRYSNAGLLETEREYDGRDTLLRQTTYTNENGFLAGEEVRGATGALQSSVRYRNDQAGNPLETEFYNRAGKLIETKKQTWLSFTRSGGEY